MIGHATESSFKFVGERLCLDFVNTVDWRGAARPSELLIEYDDLLAWAREAGLVTEAASRRIAAAARRNPRAAAQALADALELREAIHDAFTGGRNSERGAVALGVINRCLEKAPRLHLVRRAGRRVWGGGREAGLDFALAPLAWSAAELLTSPQAARVRRCEGPGCGWLFLDQSRNRRRRWCQMSSCGNRAKARRHYARHRHLVASA